MTTCNNQDSKNINEVAELLEVSTSTLRNWERLFNIKIERTAKGSRTYKQEDIDRLSEIKGYVVKGYLLEDIKNLVGEGVTSYNNNIQVMQEAPAPEVTMIEKLLSKIDSLQEDKARLIARNEFLELQNNEFQSKLILLEAKQNKSIFSWLGLGKVLKIS